MSKENRLRTIVVDDEEDSRIAMRISIERFCPDLLLEGVCGSAEEALEMIAIQKPDLVFLDVEMPEKSGFGLLELFSDHPFQIIFVSAHLQYAIPAFRLGAVDYLLKPVDIDELMLAVAKAARKSVMPSDLNSYRSVIENVKGFGTQLDIIALPTLQSVSIIKISSILYLKSDGNYTTVQLDDGRKLVVCRQIGILHDILEPQGFFRIHHSTSINLRKLRDYIRGDGGYVIMKDGQHLDVSRRRKEAFLRVLGLR